MSTTQARAGRDLPTGPVGRPRRRRRTALVAVGLVAAVATMRAVVVEPERVGSASMSPTLCTGDLVLVQHLLRGDPEVGDVVTFRAPGDGAMTVKRVVATAGQQVALADGLLVVDGHPVVEPYVTRATVDGVYFGPVTVAAGAVFVMGDDRELSIDSRRFGSLPLESVAGRVSARLEHGHCPVR